MNAVSGQERLHFEGAVVEGKHFRDRSGVVFTAVKSRFVDCRFESLAIDQATFGGGNGDSLYQGCAFSNVKVCARAPGYARFRECTFSDAIFTELFAFGIEFIDCTFSGEFRKGFLNGQVPPRAQSFLPRSVNEIVGNDFRDQRFGDFDFRTGIDLSAQKWPPIGEYFIIWDAAAKIERAKAQVGRVDPGIAKAVIATLKVMEQQVKSGQKDLFRSVVGHSGEHRSALEVIRELAG